MVSFNFGQTIGALNCNRELEARLMIMIGSIKAGNTSRELKRDVRRILDEMLKINYITLKQHRLLYQKTQE